MRIIYYVQYYRRINTARTSVAVATGTRFVHIRSRGYKRPIILDRVPIVELRCYNNIHAGGE